MNTLRTPFRRSSKQKNAHPLYKKWGRAAESVKISLQFVIGIGLVLLLLTKLICSLISPLVHVSWAEDLVHLPTLELVAIALGYSAGMELAYTLFTEGPDEAVEPVIMGLASAMLLGFSKLEAIDLMAAAGAVVFVLALAGLFLVRHYFVETDEDNPSSLTGASASGTPNIP